MITHFKLIALIYLSVAALLNVEPKETTKLPTCLDEDGNSVDWYIAYKFPHLTGAGSLFESGYAYSYITSNSLKSSNLYRSSLHSPETDRVNNKTSSFLSKLGGSIRRLYQKQDQAIVTDGERRQEVKPNDDLYWTISAKKITDPKSMIMRTLEPVYEKEYQGIDSLFYNDSPPDEDDSSSSSKAHAKGSLLMNPDSGDSIWLTHSTPKFPSHRSGRLHFEENSSRNGQTFMCINFDLRTSGEQIINHLLTMRPLVYDSRISDNLERLLPDIKGLVNSRRGKRNRKPRENTILTQSITTKRGQQLQIFAKSPNYDNDIYAGALDKEFKTNLYVATWRNGGGTKLNSTCPRNDYHVNNIQDFKLRGSYANITWSFHNDHSKWAISEDQEKGIVCISDLNRMRSQFKRGGGAVCIKCPSCWSVFSETILDLETCPAPARPSINRLVTL